MGEEAMNGLGEQLASLRQVCLVLCPRWVTKPVLEATSADCKAVFVPVITASQKLGVWALNVEKLKSLSNLPLATFVALGKLLDLLDLQFFICGEEKINRIK